LYTFASNDLPQLFNILGYCVQLTFSFGWHQQTIRLVFVPDNMICKNLVFTAFSLKKAAVSPA
jgi:hypothetical protein